MTPAWPKGSELAIGALHYQLQDVAVYVEDRHDFVFYKELLKKVVPDIMIARPVPVGSRSEVLERCIGYDFDTLGPALFLVDGDLYWVAEDMPNRPRGLFEIPAYCVENLLVCPKGVSDIVYRHSGRIGHEDLERRLAWNEWLEEVAPLVDLFVIFAVAHQLQSGIKTVQRRYGRYITQVSNRRIRIDSAKVKGDIREIREQLEKKFGEEEVGSRIESVKRRVDGLGRKLDIVSGKDFLLPLIKIRASKIVGSIGSVDFPGFRLMMCMGCRQGSGLTALADAVRGAADQEL